jgi:quercetin dioxygenase-like cupin family protein
MCIRSHEDNIEFKSAGHHKGGTLIDSSHGAVNGFSIGISYYDDEAYGQPGSHEDQEGFYVLEGKGVARVGDEEFNIAPGVSFIAHAGVPHTIRKISDSKPVKMLWCHGAI